LLHQSLCLTETIHKVLFLVSWSQKKVSARRDSNKEFFKLVLLLGQSTKNNGREVIEECLKNSQEVHTLWDKPTYAQKLSIETVRLFQFL